MRNALLACFLFLTVTAGSAGSVRAGDSYNLEYKLARGSRIKVEERRTSSVQNMYQNQGTKVGGAEERASFHRYTQEIQSDKPEILLREYEVSTRSKNKPKAKPKARKTSLHGQRVRVVEGHMQPVGQFEIHKDDREAIRFDRLPAVFLPAKRQVRIKDTWKVSGQKIAAAILPPSWKVMTKSSGGKVTLKAVKTVKGRRIAILKVKARIVIERTAAIPGIEFGFKGEIKWAIDDGVCVEATLSGPTKIDAQLNDDNNPGEWSSEGTYHWTYKAEIIEVRLKGDDTTRNAGLPPPPGIEAIVCELNKDHRFKLEHMPRCTLCGDPLRAEDRKCPNGDPWTYQYCPYDGARLNPE